MIKKLRVPALVLAWIILCGMLSGCDAFDSLFSSDLLENPDSGRTFEDVGGMSFSYSPYYTPTDAHYAYDLLDARQQMLYDSLSAVIGNVSPAYNRDLGAYPIKSVRVEGTPGVAQMRVAIHALLYDHPYYFWLTQSFSHFEHPGGDYTDFVAYSAFSPDELRRMIPQADAALNDFFLSAPEGMSPYEREKYAHDYLIDLCEYDHEAASLTHPEQNFRSHGVYGALADHRCVCEGYGRTLQLMLCGLGVDCITLTGTSYNSAATEDRSDEELHLWNAVLLDGGWYHVDPTWDDQPRELKRYMYFNLTDRMVAADHTVAETVFDADEERITANGTTDLNLFVPACNRTEYHYFAYECPHLTRYDDSEVKAALLDAARRREQTLTVYIDPDYLSFDEAVDLLFTESPQYFFAYVSDVNEMLDDCEIDNGNLTYYTNRKRCTVTVELRYY